MVNMLQNYDKIIGVQNSLTIIYTKNCCVPWQEIVGFHHLPCTFTSYVHALFQAFMAFLMTQPTTF